MDLFLRKVIHPQAVDNSRVLLKEDDGIEVEIGSIGIRHGSGAAEYWTWGVDTMVPMRDINAHGRGKDRADRMLAVQGSMGKVRCRSCPPNRIFSPPSGSGAIDVNGIGC